MFLKKSMVLIGVKSENEKAVLSLEQKGDIVEGRVRLYNYACEPSGILSIGFYDNKEVVKAGLSRVSSMLFNFKVDSSKIPENFSCAVVNFSKGDISPILFGSTKKTEDSVEKLGKIMTSELEQKTSVKEVEKVLDDNKIDYSDQLKAEIEQEIDKNMCNDCASCKYKKAFYERDKKDVENLTENQESSVKKTFFDEIKGQIDGLFKNNSKEEFLEEIIPNSKWVKVEYEESGDYYILGLIYDFDELKYIVYGVPGVYQKTPPKEISGYPVWFPLDKERRESFGYWLSYQDAQTGESIKAVVE